MVWLKKKKKRQAQIIPYLYLRKNILNRKPVARESGNPKEAQNQPACWELHGQDLICGPSRLFLISARTCFSHSVIPSAHLPMNHLPFPLASFSRGRHHPFPVLGYFWLGVCPRQNSSRAADTMKMTLTLVIYWSFHRSFYIWRSILLKTQKACHKYCNFGGSSGYWHQCLGAAFSCLAHRSIEEIWLKWSHVFLNHHSEVCTLVNQRVKLFPKYTRRRKRDTYYIHRNTKIYIDNKSGMDFNFQSITWTNFRGFESEENKFILI